MDVESYIAERLGELFSQEDYSQYFLLEVQENGVKYTVFIDSDTGISLGDLQRISRYLEEKLEEQKVVPERYTLDVSSPGTERPMTMPRQYGKHVGRKLKVTKHDETSVTGVLEEVGEDGVTLTVKQKKETHTQQIPFTEISGSVVQISFK